MRLLVGSIVAQKVLKKRTENSMAGSRENGAPSFVTGLGLGLLAGAAGFVLFGTKKGTSIRRDLKKAFAEAYHEEIAAGEVTGEAVSLREFLTTAYSKVRAEFKLDEQAAEKLSSSNGKRKLKRKTHKEKSVNTNAKFKGTK